MEFHGFNAKKEKPYKGIGDPFYLDEDKLILHALGQLPEVLIKIDIVEPLLEHLCEVFLHFLFVFTFIVCFSIYINE